MPIVSDEHRQARREQILLAAMGCVAEEGFHKTTMAQVIKASGLSAGAVYGYFRSKQELILAIADKALGYLDLALDDVLGMEPVPSPVDVTRYLTHTIAARADSGPVDLTRVVVAAWAEAVRDDTVRAAVAERIGQLRHRYADLIRAQQAAGVIDPTADPEVVAKSLFGVMPGFVLQRLVTRDVTADGYADGYAALRTATTGAAAAQSGLDA